MSMQYSSKDLEFIGKEVVAGRYVHRTTCILGVLLALALGGMAGYMFGSSGDAGGEIKQPLGQSDQGGAQPGMNIGGNAGLFDSILQHEEQVRKEPGNVDAWVHLGNLYFDTDQPAKAAEAYEKALALKPDQPDVLVDCGVMYRQLKQYDKALEYFRKALKINPRHEFALFNSGVVLYHDMNRPQEGLEAWRALVRLNPEAKAPDGRPVSALIDDISNK